MKAFIFGSWRSAEFYFWLRREHSTFCDELKAYATSDAKNFPSVDDTLALDEDEKIWSRMEESIREHIEEEAAKIVDQESGIFSDVLYAELESLDYAAIAKAILLDVEEPPQPKLPEAL